MSRWLSNLGRRSHLVEFNNSLGKACRDVIVRDEDDCAARFVILAEVFHDNGGVLEDRGCQSVRRPR